MPERKAPSDEVLIDLYLQRRLSSGMIAKKYGMARVTICRHLRRLGITRPESGINSRNRNFHKQQFRSGYPVRFVPGHPRSNHLGYAFEHVLNMEKRIARTPNKNEPVHHIDLDRANPHISNLYLCRSHKEHQEVHKSLDMIAQTLIKRGTIKFKNGRYYLDEN